LKQREAKSGRRRYSLALKIFCALLALVILPLYLTAAYVLSRYESYFRDELSESVTSTLVKSESELESAFDNLSNIANIFCVSEDLQSALQNPDMSYYERMLVFDSVVGNIELNNLSAADSVQITMLDKDGRVYSNWPLDFKDYSFLQKDESFSSEALRKGHLVWKFFTDPYIYGDNPENKYIGLARGITAFNVSASGMYLGTISVSIRQSELSKILERYRYAPGDYITVCGEDGSVLLQYSGTGTSSSGLNDFSSRQTVSGGSASGSVQKIGGNSYLVCSYQVTKKWIAGQRTLTICHFTDYSAVTSRVAGISSILNTTLAICFVIIVVIVAVLSWLLVRPIRSLAVTLSHYELEKDYAFVVGRRRDEIGQLNRSFREMDLRMKDLFHQLETENRIKEQYKLDFLRAQLNPHFLFNTLGTIRWMAIAQHMTNIVECIDALANMLRYSMSKGEELVTLQEEIRNIGSYIKIQNYRYGNRYRVNDRIDPSLYDCMLIRFILQPVIENAVLHAFADTNGEGEITLTASAEDAALTIVIEDNGRGIPAEVLRQLNAETPEQPDSLPEDGYSRQFNKIGVRNVQEQIRIRYGKAFGLRFESDGASGTRCIYRLPLMRAKPEDSLPGGNGDAENAGGAQNEKAADR
jgi:two-component system sensor histidine kinase YesM